MFENKRWFLHSFFQFDVLMAVYGVTKCWAAEILVKHGEHPWLALHITEMCKQLIDIDWLLGIPNVRVLHSLISSQTHPRSRPSTRAKHWTCKHWFSTCQPYCTLLPYECYHPIRQASWPHAILICMFWLWSQFRRMLLHSMTRKHELSIVVLADVMVNPRMSCPWLHWLQQHQVPCQVCK